MGQPPDGWRGLVQLPVGEVLMEQLVEVADIALQLDDLAELSQAPSFIYFFFVSTGVDLDARFFFTPDIPRAG